MDTIERIALHLRRPTTDPLFSLDPATGPPSALVLSSNVDNSTGLTYGALKGDWKISNETARAVIAIYQAQGSDNFTAGAAIMLGLSSGSAHLVGALVVLLGLDRHIWHLSGASALHLGMGLANALKHLPRTSTDSELDAIKRWAMTRFAKVQPISDEPVHRKIAANQRAEFSKLLSTVEDVQRFRDRTMLLKGGNPIVDRDRRELIDRLATLAVPEVIRTLIDQADRDADSGDYKGALEKCRTFLERTYEACCRRHTAEGVDPLPEAKAGGSIGPWLHWAKQAGLLKQKEQDVVQALSSFLAMEGSHAATSERRQFDVGKACVIEWCLLVADRVR